MPRKSRGKRPAKQMLRLPDLDQFKTSVLQSLGSVASKRTYAYAINDFRLGTAPNPVWPWSVVRIRRTLATEPRPHRDRLWPALAVDAPIFQSLQSRHG
jgi:hypothetical protein